MTLKPRRTAEYFDFPARMVRGWARRGKPDDVEFRAAAYFFSSRESTAAFNMKFATSWYIA